MSQSTMSQSLRRLTLPASLLVLAVLAALFVATVAPAGAAITAPAAAAAPTISIAPVGASGAYFTVTVPAGTSHVLRVRFANSAAVPATASTYAADVYTIANGGFGALLKGAKETGVTTWLSYPPSTIRLGAHATEQTNIVVTVPAGTTPGEHVTSLVVQAAPVATTKGAISLREVARAALPVVIDVPGAISPGLSLHGVHQFVIDNRSVVSVGVDNSGNVREHLVGRLSVASAAGKEVANVALSMGTVYPGDRTTSVATLGEILAPGTYRVRSELGDATLSLRAAGNFLLVIPQSGSVTTTPPAATFVTTTTSGLPLGTVVGIVLGALLVGGATAVAITAVERRRRRETEVATTTPDDAPDASAPDLVGPVHGE